jgi:hypothetical protein
VFRPWPAAAGEYTAWHRPAQTRQCATLSCAIAEQQSIDLSFVVGTASVKRVFTNSFFSILNPTTARRRKTTDCVKEIIGNDAEKFITSLPKPLVRPESMI